MSRRTEAAEKWLAGIAAGTDPNATEEERDHALTILGALQVGRSVAGSALTQKVR